MILAWSRGRLKKRWMKYLSLRKNGELYFSCGSLDCSEIFASTNKIESDEADVYLDSRGSKGEADVSKNALVSGSYAKLRLIAKSDNVSYAPGSRVFQRHFDNDH